MRGIVLGITLLFVALITRISSQKPVIPGTDSYAYLTGIFSFYPNEITAVIAGIFLTLLSTYLVILLSRRLKMPDLPWVFALSPYYLYTALFVTPAAIVQPLMLLGVLSWLAGRIFIMQLIFVLLGWFGIAYAVVSFVILVLLKKRPWLAVPAVLYYLVNPFFVKTKGLLVEFGSRVGVSSFAVLLAVIGVVLLWKYKRKHYWVFVAGIFLVIAGAYEQSLLVYSNLVVCGLVSIAIAGIRKAKWVLQDVKAMFMILLFCGLLFSGISYATTVAELPPGKEVADALKWLRVNSKFSARVYSDESNGFWINYFAKRQALTTPWDTDETAREILQNYDLKKTILFMSRNAVTHVFLTKDMINKVWVREGQGLMFVLGNQDVFEKVYSDDYATIYSFKGEH